jgi:hypothetical protein
VPPLSQPEPFLNLAVHDLGSAPTFSGLDVGYEAGAWPGQRLAEHVLEWLPEFALRWSELVDISHANAVKRIRKAARRVYTTDKFHRRGEFGELFLHICLRQTFDTLPAVCKIYYKTANNDTVKGFDAVHVVASDTISNYGLVRLNSTMMLIAQSEMPLTSYVVTQTLTISKMSSP